MKRKQIKIRLQKSVSRVSNSVKYQQYFAVESTRRCGLWMITNKNIASHRLHNNQ